MRYSIAFLLFTLSAVAQTQFSGASELFGSSVIPATPTQNVYIYVVFPPETDPMGGMNNTNFRAHVMTQNAIAGVTVQINWSAVETSIPSSGSCGAISDTCQQDTAMQYHVYNWSTVDGSACTSMSNGTGLGQWFCPASVAPWGAAKAVNPLIFGVSSNPNISTPDYVFGSAWATTVGASVPQEVINDIKDSCGGYTGYSGTTSPSVTSAKMSASGLVTITMSSLPFSNGDIIWLSGFSTSPQFNTTGQTGFQITVPGSNGGNSFDYTPGTCMSGCTKTSVIGNVISAQASWPIPSELPYKVAFRAFVAAAVAHFGTATSSTVVAPAQVAYMRVGYARGGEALAECPEQWPSFTSDSASKSDWLSFYADMSSFLMGAASNSGLHLQAPINTGGEGITDTSYATAEADLSVNYVGGDGKVFGFGSQGMQKSDITAMTCASDWCSRFGEYWAGGSNYKYTGFELQQIDCSGPTAAGVTGLACGENANISLTRDLRPLVDFAVSEHMTILELYAQDALLAYDPNFCTVSGGSCSSSVGASCTGSSGDFFPTLSSALQNQFYQCVGQGSSCGGGTGTGDCSYQAHLNAASGQH
jgi:hypothetical protein